MKNALDNITMKRIRSEQINSAVGQYLKRRHFMVCNRITYRRVVEIIDGIL